MSKVEFNEITESYKRLLFWQQLVDLSSYQEIWLGIFREKIRLWQKQQKALKFAEGILCMSQYTNKSAQEDFFCHKITDINKKQNEK